MARKKRDMTEVVPLRQKAPARMYTEEERERVVNQVFEWFPDGVTIAQASRRLKMPERTVRSWVTGIPEYRERYLAARPMLGNALAEEALQIARTSTSQTTSTDRVLIETLKWMASKCAPEDYGDRQVVVNQGEQTLKVQVLEEEGAKRYPRAVATLAQ